MPDAPLFTFQPEVRRRFWSSLQLLGEDGLDREDERPDEVFYGPARLRPFYRRGTRAALRDHHDRILPRDVRRILDLGASLESHLPARPGCEVVGLGLNEVEMDDNPALETIVVHDLNLDPRLPFADESFDAVVCSGTIDLLVHPLEVMREIARVLREGGVLVVSFTERSIRPKAIRAWLDEDLDGRIRLATAFFSFSTAFTRPVFEVEDLAPEPGADEHASAGDESLVVVWGYRPPAGDVVVPRERPTPRLPVASPRHCPWCGEPMLRWEPPRTPWEIDYGVDHLWVCFNDDCPYFVNGRAWCRRHGLRCASYRHSRDPATGAEGPLPVPGLAALRTGIVEEPAATEAER